MTTPLTRVEMAAIIDSGIAVVFDGIIYLNSADLPTQEEIDAVYATLQGPPGEQGPAGPQGPQGEPGTGTGDVNGPASATNNNIAVFDGTTGKLIKDGGATIASKQDALGFTAVPNTRTVNGHALSSNVTVSASDVGLGSVDNTTDLNKPVSTAQAAAISAAVTGVAIIRGSTDASANPNYPVGVKGDLYYVSVAGKIGGASGKSVDVGDTYIALANNAGGTEASVGTSWFVLEHNLAGALVATNNLSDVSSASTARSNLGLGNVDNTSNATERAATATLTNKTLTSPVINTPTGIVKGDVGLGNVDNTSDANKPVSTATQTAINSTAPHYRTKIKQALGSPILAETVELERIAATLTMTDGRIEFQAIYLPVAGTVTGVKWWQAVQGSYTGDNNSKVGLYTYSGGTLTLVASCADDTALWKVGTQAFGTKAFSSTYSAAAGTYFIGVLWNASATTTAPQLVAGNSAYVATAGAFEYTNSAKSMGFITGQNDLPATQAMSGVTTLGIPVWLGLY